MKDFQKIDWKTYSRPPFYQQWLCRDDTLKLTTFGDKGLAEVDAQVLVLKDQWDLENVEGHFLDRIGKLLNEKRNGNIDSNYRIILKLRRLLNTNNGSIPSIIKAVKFFYGSEIVHIVPNYPAGLKILHDGEGTPGLDFNKIFRAVIAAGIGYETRELFYFKENILSTENQQIVIKNALTDSFSEPLYFHNGRILRDGHTVRPQQAIPFAHNGNHTRNGNLNRSSFFWEQAHGIVRFPLLYGSGIRDRLKLNTDTGKCIEGHRSRIFRNGSIYRDGSELHQNTGNKPAYDFVRMGFRKHYLHNGTYSRNGTIKRDGMVLIPVE
jgi:hypothetical protein